MKYADGSTFKPGDEVQIDVAYRGVVVADLDTGEFLPGHEGWAYLGTGAMIDTDFGGLVHYTADSDEPIVLLRRAPR